MAGTSSEAASVHGRADHRGRGMFRRPGTSMAGESTNRWVDDRTGSGTRSGQAGRLSLQQPRFQVSHRWTFGVGQWDLGEPGVALQVVYPGQDLVSGGACGRRVPSRTHV